MSKNAAEQMEISFLECIMIVNNNIFIQFSKMWLI
jgi:hypothetical protein